MSLKAHLNFFASVLREDLCCEKILITHRSIKRTEKKVHAKTSENLHRRDESASGDNLACFALVTPSPEPNTSSGRPEASDNPSRLSPQRNGRVINARRQSVARGSSTRSFEKSLIPVLFEDK